MNDFIFGTLATQKLRRARVEGQRADVNHNHRRFPRDPNPGQAVFIEITSGPAHPCDRAWVYWTVDGNDPEGSEGISTNGYSLPLEFVEDLWDTVLWGYIRRFQGMIPGQPAGTIVRYRTSIESNLTGEVFADSGAFEAYYVDQDPIPEWTKDAIIYQIFPDRFYPGDGILWQVPESPDGFYGGKLAGIIEKLDYIAGMGFNTIWLNPIFPSPSHHGYDATDLFSIEPRLGTLKDFLELANQCKKRNIRILLDFVPNHWSHLHPTFQNAISDPASQYREWYKFSKYPNDYETFFGVRELPQLNLRNPDAKKHICGAAIYWLNMGVDGFRLDYAIGPSHDFWADFRKATRQVNPECWTFGEIVDPPDVQLSYQGLMDGCLDFMLLEAIRQTFGFGRWNGIKFASFLQRHLAYFLPGFSLPSFLDNHDMNRFLWACGGNKKRLKMAAMCQFMLPGQPVVYYGTETGLSQERDVRQGSCGVPEESRLPMDWEKRDEDLINFYQQMIRFRKNHKEVINGDFKITMANTTSIGFSRAIGKKKCVGLFNLSRNDKKFIMELDEPTRMIKTDSNISMIRSDAKTIFFLPGLSGVINIYS